jgi:uncharacterized protein (DUF1501 family)
MLDFTRPTRRVLLTRGVGLMSVGAIAPGYLLRSAASAAADDGAPAQKADHRVAVVLQMSGGHDSLSELVPYSDKAYHEARQATRIGEDEVIKLDERLGLHPNLKGFKDLLDDGAFAAIAGVGYPKPNYSHFTSTDIWHTADPRGRELPAGWVGRACDHAFKECDDPKLAIAVGAGSAPLAIKGRTHAGLAFSRPESWRYTGDRGDKQRASLYRMLNSPDKRPPGQPASDSQDYVSRTADVANQASEVIRRLAAAHQPKVEYPNTGLGRNLRIIAGQIIGGLSTRVYFTFQGGYDTHRGQRPGHDKRMTELNDAVHAFIHDLKQQGHADRVLLFTTSEFGRRVKENGSEGTDHGAAASLYLFGPGVKPGVHGEFPSLTDLQGGGGGSLKHTADFRSVYATVLEKWLGIPSEPVLGEAFGMLDFIA